jgi:hypothetical protein
VVASELDGVGSEVEISIGPNVYSPVKYNSFTVGPVRVRVQPGDQEELCDTYARAAKTVGMMYEIEFEAALSRYLRDLRRAADGTREAAGNRRG